MVGHGIRWYAIAIFLGSALAAGVAGVAGAAAPENTLSAASEQRTGVATVRTELVSLRAGLPSYWSRYWLDNAIESADWAAESSCWTASGELVTTTDGLGCLQALRTVVLRLYYADTVLRGASKPQRQETVDLIASIAADRLAAVASAQGVDESEWRASGPTATLWSARADLRHANADSNRIEATIGYIRAWRRLTTKVEVNSPELDSQSIAFGPLAAKVFGDPDFGVDATASSGLAVTFAAGGNCNVSGNTVKITSAGSCTVTASQAGDSTFGAAADVSRTFSIAKAGQTIAANPPAAASSASSTSLTLAAAAATSSTHSTGAAPARPTRCKVPNLVGKGLAAALRAVKAGHCRTGTVRRAFSRKGKKGNVITQNRRRGQLLPAKAKINLVVSRGRKR